MLLNKIKTNAKQQIVNLINKSNNNLIKNIFYYWISSDSSRFKYIIKKLNSETLSNYASKSILIKRFNIFNEIKCKEYVYKTICAPHTEYINTPEVWGISNGGTISINQPGIYLYKFENAEISSSSDFVRIGNSAYWDKRFRFQLTKTYPLDNDLILWDKESDSVFLHESKNKIEIDIGFSMCGVHMTSWGHFVGNFLPKLSILTEIEQPEKVSLIIPKNIDNQIKDLIRIISDGICVKEIIEIDEQEIAACNKLYYCSSPSFIADHTDYIQPYDTHISDWALSKIKLLSSAPCFNKFISESPKKLFIGRHGNRNLKNYSQVYEFFIQNGYEVIYPHELSLTDKASLFYNATHICGPLSSGFGNVIYCRTGTKVLAFANIARIMDTYVSDLCNNLEFTLVTGDEDLPAGPHQNYEIPLQKIKEVALAKFFI